MIELIKIQTELKCHKGQFNKFGGYAYRSTEDILEALKPLLLANNAFLTLSDEIVLIGDRYYIKATATLTNEKGAAVQTTAYAREPLTKKGMDEAQITGSASSYARKYALNGLFAIDDTKDADATNTHDNAPQNKPQMQNKPKLNAEQIGELSELITATQTNINDFLAYFKAYDLADVPYQRAKDMLLKKAAAKGA